MLDCRRGDAALRPVPGAVALFQVPLQRPRGSDEAPGARGSDPSQGARGSDEAPGHGTGAALGDVSWTMVGGVPPAPPAPPAPHDGYRYFLILQVICPPGTTPSGHIQAHQPPCPFFPSLSLQMGPNSSGNDCFFIGGMELYGTLTMDPTLDVR